MADFTEETRIDIRKLDKATIDSISSDIARKLTAIAQGDADQAFHVKVGHISAGFSKSGHTNVMIGGQPGQQQPSGSSG
jgi:hypothetical protein